MKTALSLGEMHFLKGSSDLPGALNLRWKYPELIIGLVVKTWLQMSIPQARMPSL